jgi:hypothetical protein
MTRLALPLALLLALPACKEDDPDDSAPEADTDADTDTDTDTDADGDTDVNTGTDLGELADGWQGVDTNLGPFDALNSTVSCQGGTWSVTMLDAEAKCDEAWFVAWETEDNLRTGAFLAEYDAGTRLWSLQLSEADLGFSCDKADSTIIFFLPVAGDMLGTKAASTTGTCTGAGFGTWDVDQYMFNVSTMSPVDLAQVSGFQMFTEVGFGPLDMNELSSDTWDLLYDWPDAGLSMFGQEVLLAYRLTSGGEVVGAGGW